MEVLPATSPIIVPVISLYILQNIFQAYLKSGPHELEPPFFIIRSSRSSSSTFFLVLHCQRLFEVLPAMMSPIIVPVISLYILQNIFQAYLKSGPHELEPPFFIIRSSRSISSTFFLVLHCQRLFDGSFTCHVSNHCTCHKFIHIAKHLSGIFEVWSS